MLNLLCPKQSWSNPMLEVFSMFPCRRFMILALAFSPISIFSLFFDLFFPTPSSSLFFFLMNVQLFQHHWLKRLALSFPPVELPWHLFWKLIGHVCSNYYLDNAFSSIVLCMCLLIDWYRTVWIPLPLLKSVLKSGNLGLPILFTFFQIALVILGPLNFHITFTSNVLILERSKQRL